MIENYYEGAIDQTKALHLKKHIGTYLVSFAVLGERFSFWGLQAVMVNGLRNRK